MSDNDRDPSQPSAEAIEVGPWALIAEAAENSGTAQQRQDAIARRANTTKAN